ncbi:putative vps54-likeVacuolar protein sorting-associated protein [Medicago truncatula]|uniref:Putative vps54-likeVacuolar protein sorting-associated protein n=1 Tax=Medicago truncatula TaxID=3880 RepID=A0A072V8X8_MEDTR|nr:vacuolar protein sorting-associated protein 54, chloroplastic [Medicago truncatula]KEH37803.1 vacuolar sorting protein [Medicago truncatula]RHN73878.1 putative vps54-likeVacuolar protein sorting-associated protein [Medicago truncatula]
MDSPPSQQPSWGRSPTFSTTHLNRTTSTSSSTSSPSFSKDSSTIQSLSSILNNPLSSTTISSPEFTPISSTKSTSTLTRSDFLPYLSSLSDPFHRFDEIRKHANNEISTISDDGGAGEALVACLREVPSLYFKQDFHLEEGATFRAACPFSTFAENAILQEKLSQYLDVVELHLVKEISLRSSSFFEAQGELQDLNGKIVEGCTRIRELKDTVRLIDSDLVESARQIQLLNGTRTNLLALQQKLRLILYVNQALSALKLLVASADCAGALDVTDDLQHLLDGDELTGLHCFRHLRDHVTGFIESINSILSAEFIRASLHDAAESDVIILSKAKSRASLLMNGKDDEAKLEEETTNFKDSLLPTVIGLLRTAKLPSVLRIYRDTLTADMKSAIKTAVAELLPVIAARASESEFFSGDRAVEADGGGASLASKLKSLSSDCFVHLLSAIFTIVQAHLVRAAEVKKAIEWILSNCDGHYASDSVAAAIAHGAAAAEISQESEVHGTTFLPYSPQKNVAKGPSFQGKAIDAVSSSNMSKNFRADVLRENAEAVFAACDAAHGRWAKLLGVRTTLHPRLKLQEFLTVYNITHEFITATEKIGGRLGYSIRGILHSQAKAFIDCQHDSRASKIMAVLDQETWVEIDVPDEFQSIINTLFPLDALSSGDPNGVEEDNSNSYHDLATNNDARPMADTGQSNAEQNVEQTDSTDESKKPNRGHSKSLESISTEKDQKKSASQPLFYKGVGYHMVNCGLILLKMLSEYIDMNNLLPALSSEVVHRVVEILKYFNTRTCQLVLGAKAMQVSGLKSITSKHLALASQVISFIHAIIPEIRQILFLKVPENRKLLLLSEIDRVAQDYKVHRDEIHTKLVQIMRERLLVHLRGLPQIVESWNRPEDADPQPSQFARSLTKEVGFLQRVLSRTLNEDDVQAIFRQVVVIFHSQISEAFSRFDISTSQAQNRLYRDIKHILQCIRSLPSGDLSKSDTPNWGQLDEFLVQRFGNDAVQ